MTDVFGEIESLLVRDPLARKKFLIHKAAAPKVAAPKAAAPKVAAPKVAAPKAAAPKAAAVATFETKESAAETNSLTPLVALFQAIQVRILGTVDDPLFSALDVAAYINDSHNYLKKISKYAVGKYVQKHNMINSKGEVRMSWLLTEAGVYKYLTQSKGEKAEEFQEFVYDLLKAERKRTVDAVQLALKITQTKLEESERKNKSLQRRESELYQATNDARERNARLTRENAKLLKAKYAAEDAAYMHKMGRGHLLEEPPEEEAEGDEGDADEGDDE